MKRTEEKQVTSFTNEAGVGVNDTADSAATAVTATAIDSAAAAVTATAKATDTATATDTAAADSATATDSPTVDNTVDNTAPDDDHTAKLSYAPVNFVNIPKELKAVPSFCLWRSEKRNGHPTKVPYNPKPKQLGQFASTDDPTTFGTFLDAMKAYAMGDYDGIGFRVSEGIGAIDLDHCIREDGSLNDVAASILSFFPDTYFEHSPSGSGLRAFFRLSPDFVYDKSVYYINNRKLGLEVYLPNATNRFVTVTGCVYQNGAISMDDSALQAVLDKFMKRRTVSKPAFQGSAVSYFTDEQVIEHASNSKNGEKFKSLMNGNWEDYYGSQSDADMALVSIRPLLLRMWQG